MAGPRPLYTEVEALLAWKVIRYSHGSSFLQSDDEVERSAEEASKMGG